MKRHRVLWAVLAAFMLLGLLLSGCSGVLPASEEQGAASADDDADGEGGPALVGETEPVQATEEPMEEVGPQDFGVPADDANVVNPITADDASLQRGEELYTISCVKCHGEEGRGDGPVGRALNPKPLDFRAEQVKQLSEGELFYIVTHGIDGTGMPPFEAFDEGDRWHLVNYLRSFQE